LHKGAAVLLHIPRVLTPAQLAHCRQVLERAQWVDGKVTAGFQSANAKNNLQVPEDHPAARELGDMVLEALEGNALFIAAALPLKVFPPLFNRYAAGHHFANHVDNAIRQVPGRPHRVRTDLSATLFLAAPEEYDGGELVIYDSYGAHAVKLPAGDMVLYPAGSLHRVEPVTRGARIASFFWIQSMVRDDGKRTLLFDLDTAIRKVGQQTPDSPAVVELTAVYHNLLRRWADA
jgi:PKHD-type hydroxylase